MMLYGGPSVKDDCKCFSLKFFDAAVREAKKAAQKNEVPVGAVIVRGDEIISRAHNMRERKQNALYHAEVLAVNKACKKLKSWRLDDCEMYVTLEPCQMCMGAITNARLERVYIGTSSSSDLNWEVEVVFCDSHECAKMLKDFFASKR
jgi:tRNA(adenine34) deaminase